MGLFDKLRLLSEFGDELVALLGMAAEFSAATTIEAKAQIVVRGLKLVAAQTPSDVDDLAAEFLKQVFAAPEVVASAKRLLEAIQRASAS